jgi:hypothetical protein
VTENGTLFNTGLVGIPTRLATLAWYLALATGTTTLSTTDTTAEGEITTGGLARAAATASYEASYKLLLTKSWLATANQTAINKIYVFESAGGTAPDFGNKYASTHTVLNGNSIVGTIRITFGGG